MQEPTDRMLFFGPDVTPYQQDSQSGHQGDGQQSGKEHGEGFGIRQRFKESASDAATADWHLYMLLGQVDSADDVIRQTTSTDVLYSRASWLFYGQFDPTPFPELMSVLARENVIRKPTVVMPFACK